MFKPLRDLVLIEQEEIVQEEIRASGIVLLKSSFNLYGWDDEDARAKDIIDRKKQNKGKIIAVGGKCNFLKNGDAVIYKKQAEQKLVEVDGKECVFVSEADVLCKEVDGVLICHPDNLIIKISRESRDSVFTKKIKRDDGSFVELFMYNPTAGKDSESHDKHFVASGIVMGVGSNIKNVKVNDIAILDYMADNDDSIIVGYDGEDKLIVTSPLTKYSTTEEWVYASRRKEEDPKKQSYGHPLCPHDIKVGQVGDYENMAQILGVLRGEELISFDPYVFLVHEETVIKKVSASGILYSVDEKILTRKVLAAAEGNKYGLTASVDVIVDDFDIFDIYFEGKRISAVNDVDVIMVK
jgi:co-chaperonin GroES (HSP10)